MNTGAPRALVIGAVTWDYDLDHARGVPRPGGVSTFAGRTLARCGVETRVVTRIASGDDRVLDPLRAAGVEVLALPSERTTTYGNRYDGSVDRHELWERSDTILPDDVPSAWRRESDVLVAGPLHPHDVDPGCIGDAGGMVGVDLQGLLRGEPLGHDEVQRLVRAWCAVSRIVQVSAADLVTLFDATSARAIRAAYGVQELLITRGARGTTVADSAGVVEVPVAKMVQGETRGAGDTHLAAYVLARAQGHGPSDAGAMAAVAAAECIEAARRTAARSAEL